MPLYMDVHNKVEGLTAEAVAGAHQRDLQVQEKHGVKYLKYWFNADTGQVWLRLYIARLTGWSPTS
jgi:Nickel responsive protein SCO4226-like